MTLGQNIDFTGPARFYAQRRTRRLDQLRPKEVQVATLKRLINRASGSAFGRAYRFDQISDLDSYQRQVTIRDYHDFWKEWWEPHYPTLVDVSWPGRVPYFTLTSGTTTGRSKHIPYTTEMRRAAVRGFIDLLCFHLVRRPQSRLMGGSALVLTGPASLDEAADGTTKAAVSAITSAALPSWLQHRVLPPADLANLDDWREKIRRLAPLSLSNDVRMLGGSPNWLLIFLAQVASQQENFSGRLADLYPELELIVHGGVNFAPYRDRFTALLDGSHAETREMYSASEGVFAYADNDDGQGLRLHLDGNIFFEFVPPDQLKKVAPDRRWIGNIETNTDYAIVITSAAGLWSYVVGDIVRFVETDPPRLLVVGRVQQGLSTFGEHLIESELAEAVAKAAREQNVTVLDYSVGSVQGETGGHHVYLVEPIENASDISARQFAGSLDSRLSELNGDYEELRRNRAVGAPEVRVVPNGGFTRWMELRRGLGGQNKVPRVVTDPELFDDILQTVTKLKGGPDDQ